MPTRPCATRLSSSISPAADSAAPRLKSAAAAPTVAAQQTPRAAKAATAQMGQTSRVEAAPAPTMQAKPQDNAAIAASVPAPRARRVRAPKNLAAQYGEKATRRVVAGAATEVAVRTRRDAAARAKRRQAMQVNEDLLQRLARAGTAGALVVGETSVAHKPRRVRTSQTRCGKCGRQNAFKTAAALCSGCDTILLREAIRNA